MEFIKNFFVGVAQFAYDFFIAPIVELRNLFDMPHTSKAIALMEAASRIIIMASWFVAVPALLVVLAWTWIIGTVVYVAAHVCFGLGALVALGAFSNSKAAELNKEEVVINPMPAAAAA